MDAKPSGAHEAGGPAGRGGVVAIPSVALEVAIAVVMVAVALWFWLEAGSIQSQAPGSISGPVAFPRGVAAMLAVCSLLLIFRSVTARMRTGGSRPVVVKRPAPVLASIVLVVVYPLLLEWLGYYVATGVWLPVLLWVSGYRRPLGVVLASLAFLVFTKVVFQQMLGTPLP